MRRVLSSVFAKAPVPYVARSSAATQGVGAFQRSDRLSQMAAMGASGTLFSIVSMLANATALTDWSLYRKSSSTKDDREEVGQHLALKVWDKPNQFMTRQEFIEVAQQHLDLTGESWWLVEKVGGTSIPSGLWPVRPDRMVPVPHPTDFLSGYIYLSPDGQRIPLDLNEVIFLRLPNPLDPYRGMGPVQAVLTDIDASDQAAVWSRNFFKNNARPGGVIETPEAMSDAEFRTFNERWREQHQGVGNAHRVAILERAVWKDVSYSMRDLQFSELRSMSREIIREAFAYPKPMLGAVDDVNRANAEAGEVVFGRWHVRPRCERIKQALNSDFLPLFGTTGQGVEFDYADPVPEDRAAEATDRGSRVAAVAQLVSAGYHPDDALQAMGLPPMRHTAENPNETVGDE